MNLVSRVEQKTQIEGLFVRTSFAETISTGPKAGEVTRYWKNYIRSLKFVYFT